MTKADEWIRSFAERHINEIIVAALFILSVLLRITLASKTSWSGDYLYCIAPWVDRYRELGAAAGLSQEITNYYIPYNVFLAFVSLFPMEPWVLVSILSCAAEYLGVYYAWKTLTHLSGTGSWRTVYAALSLLFLPPMVLNGAFWKQCDAVYTAFALMALYYLLSDKYYRAFLFLSIAFVFKLQVILLFPLFFFAYFAGKRYCFLLWLRIPVTYLEAGLPAIICGRDPKEVYSVYLNQSGEYHFMFLNTGNIHRLFRSDYAALSTAAILMTAVFLVFWLGYLYRYRERMGNERLLQLAGVTGYACFLFLPAMHERYDYLPLCLVTLYYAYYDRKRLFIPAMMTGVTTVMYCEYLFGGNTLPEEVYAMIGLAACALAGRDLVNALKTGNRREQYVDQDQ